MLWNLILGLFYATYRVGTPLDAIQQARVEITKDELTFMEIFGIKSRNGVVKKNEDLYRNPT
jgi:hypothetical protein